MEGHLRVKYRSAPIMPEMGEGKDIFKARRKKVKHVEVAGNRIMDSAIDFEEPQMCPAFTQKSKIFKTVYSDEAKYRKATQPTIFQRIEQQKKWAEMQVMEQRRNALHQKMMDSLYEQLHNLKEAADTPDADVDMSGAVEDADVFGVNDNHDTNIDQGARNAQLEIVSMKEKRFTKQRNTRDLYKDMKWGKRFQMAMSLSFGGNAGATRNEMTEILPWLFIGNATIASDMAVLVSQG